MNVPLYDFDKWEITKDAAKYWKEQADKMKKVANELSVAALNMVAERDDWKGQCADLTGTNKGLTIRLKDTEESLKAMRVHWDAENERANKATTALHTMIEIHRRELDR